MLVHISITLSILGLVSSDQVCYGKYGCFSDASPFSRPFVPLPAPPSKVGTSFQLFTRSHPHLVSIDDSDVKKLKASTYDGKKRTFVIAHGYTESGSTPWVGHMRQSLLQKDDVNVVITDWGPGADGMYWQATANTRLVGAQIAELVKFLNKQTGNTPSSFTVIGFSLGGHVAGYAGSRIKNTTGLKLGRISGLDPAGLYFVNEHVDVRLDPSDAEFVDVMHTDMDFAGTSTQSGHIDFYPNGGKNQPGCRDIADGPSNALKCDHVRAHDYFTESITSQCAMRAFPCASMHDFERGLCFDCVNNLCPSAGYNAVKSKGKAKGKYFLYTNRDEPFCVLHYRVTFKTGRKWYGGGTSTPVHIVLHGSTGSHSLIKFNARNIQKGSSESFVAPVTTDLGPLTSIDVRNRFYGVFPPWYLEKVVVEPAVGRQMYSGCFKAKIDGNGVVRKLQQGDQAC